MAPCGGRDQVVRAAVAEGWTSYECPTPFYFARAVSRARSGLVIAVGANSGFYTLLALAVSRKTRVAAYEPMASVRHILRQNLRLNAASRRVDVHAEAVSDRSGSRQLHIPDGRHGLIATSASLSASFKGEAGECQDVLAVTLDERHLRAPRVSVIKVDAESHDLQVLMGARQVLLRHRPVVFLEVLLGAGLIALGIYRRRA